jgi:short-subunit dehydrogenase
MQLELAGTNIGVSVLCPGEVKTNIVASGRSRPAHLREGSALLDFEAEAAKRPVDPNWLEVDVVGRLTVDAILKDRFYVMTHPDTLPFVRERHAAIEAAMAEAETLLAQ